MLDFFDDPIRCRQPGKLVLPDIQARLLDMFLDRSHPVGDGSDPVIPSGGGDQGAVHTNIGCDTSQHQPVDMQRSQCQIEMGSIELVVGMASNDQLVGSRGELLHSIRRFHSLAAARTDKAVVRWVGIACRIPFLMRKVFGAEWFSTQAGDCCCIDKLGENHRYTLGPAGLYNLDNIGQNQSPGSNFQRGSLVQETMLHINNDQGRLALVEAVGLVNPVTFLLYSTVDINHQA